MTAWTSDELTTIVTAEELQIASLRRDGTLRKPVTIWVVRHGEDLYVRSVNGPTAGWFRGTQIRHEGHVQAGGVNSDVTVADADHDVDAALDAAYRSKYRRYSATTLNRITSPQARSTTITLVPRRRTRSTQPRSPHDPTFPTAVEPGWGGQPDRCRRRRQ
jgi:hypothetical protein